MSVFIESFAPPPRMLIFGAVDFTAALVRVAKVLGYRVTVCDAREVFATRRASRRPTRSWSTGPTASRHGRGRPRAPRRGVRADPRPQVRRARHRRRAAHHVGYLGAMGSRRTHADRVAATARGGRRPTTTLARVMAPIGLDLGARTPEETAVSICAEIIALRTGQHGALAPRHRRPHPRA